jgi:hypothetical protein
LRASLIDNFMKGSVQACTTRVNRSSISASCLYRSLQQREAAIDYVAGAETRNRPLFDHLLQQKPGDRIDLR